ncbi:MAG: hypothetical protein GEV12_06685 [Micromonosporaceae bacterium]|nr:hypothetical protein [Micromonosporaceae bacterium]
MEPTVLLPALVLFTLVTVEFGGWSLLGLLGRRDTLSSFQEQFFRAGHAHAGVLLVLTLVSFVLMGRTEFTEPTQWLLGIGLLVGVLMQSGGFFLHMLRGREGGGSAGTLVTRVGAVVIAVVLVTLGIGLLAAG